MAVDKIWVVAESFEGKALPVTLELLTAARQLAGSVLLTRNGNGHTSYFASTCIQQAEDAYLINLTLPTNAAFRLNAATGSGGVLNDFGNIDSDVQPRAQLRVKSGIGTIHVHRGVS